VVEVAEPGEEAMAQAVPVAAREEEPEVAAAQAVGVPEAEAAVLEVAQAVTVAVMARAAELAGGAEPEPAGVL
jgi:hypothetical protein